MGKNLLSLNIGNVGIGPYKCKVNGKHTISYIIWRNMLTRCYVEREQIRNPNYIGCTVDERWHNFQVFAEWYEQNYIDGFVLDKDILFKGNKIYGPDTCCFVPEEINKLLTNRKRNRGNFPLGVYLNQNGKFTAQISKFGKRINIGSKFLTANEAFIAYKNWKENYIIDIANNYRQIILPKVYDALLNYKIEITD